MSYKHIILTVDTRINDHAFEICDMLMEAGQTCDVDTRNVGINRKLDKAEKEDYDYILVIDWIGQEINHVNIRDKRNNKIIGDMHITDFMHDLFCGKI